MYHGKLKIDICFILINSLSFFRIKQKATYFDYFFNSSKQNLLLFILFHFKNQNIYCN